MTFEQCRARLKATRFAVVGSQAVIIMLAIGAAHDGHQYAMIITASIVILGQVIRLVKNS